MWKAIKETTAHVISSFMALWRRFYYECYDSRLCRAFLYFLLQLLFFNCCLLRRVTYHAVIHYTYKDARNYRRIYFLVTVPMTRVYVALSSLFISIVHIVRLAVLPITYSIHHYTNKNATRNFQIAKDHKKTVR